MTPHTLMHRMVAAAPRSPVTHVLGSFLQLSAQTAQIMLVGHLFGPGTVGTYGYCLALITPLVLLANWHVRHARVMDGSGRFAWSAYAHLRGFSLVAVVPLLAVGLVLPGLAGFAPLYLALALQRLTEMWFDLPYSVHQRSGEIGRIGIGVGLRGCLGVLAFMAVLIGIHHLAVAVLAQAAVSWCWWVMLERPALMRGLQAEAPAGRSETSPWLLFLQLWPLGVTVALGSLVAVFPRIALAERHGLAEAGRFILLGYLFIPAILVQTAVQQMMAPRLADAAAACDGRRVFSLLMRLTTLQILMQMMVALAIVGTQQWVGLSWLAPGFSVGGSELAWFTLGQCAAIVLNSVGLAMDAYGRYRAKLFFWLALTVLGTVLTWWLATRGIAGVSVAAVVIGLSGGMVAVLWFGRFPSRRQDGSRDHG